MTNHKSQFQSFRLWNNPFATQWILPSVVVIAILLGQSSPLLAQQACSGYTNWVKICDDGGSYFNQMTPGGKIHVSDCEHCAIYLISSVEIPVSSTLTDSVSRLSEFSKTTFSTNHANLPENSEQFWRASRGPPITNLDNNMNPVASLYSTESVSGVLREWITRWA